MVGSKLAVCWLAAAALLSAGCIHPKSGLSSLHGGSTQAAAGSVPPAAPSAAPDDSNLTRSPVDGQTIQTSATMPANGAGASGNGLGEEILAQVDGLELSDEARAHLLTDLEQTPAHLRPLLLHSFRASVAYQRRAQEKKLAAEAQRGGSLQAAAAQHGSAATRDVVPTELALPQRGAPPSTLLTRRAPAGLPVEPEGAAVSYAGDEPLAPPHRAAEAPHNVGAPPAAEPPAAAPAYDARPAARQAAPHTAPQPPSAPLGAQGAAVELPAARTSTPGEILHVAYTAEPAVVQHASYTSALALATSEAHAVDDDAIAAPSRATTFAEPDIAATASRAERAEHGQPPAMPGDWRAALAQAIDALEQQSQSPPQNAEDVSRHARLRLLYLAAGRRDDALRPIDSIPVAQQEFWTHELFGLSALTDVERQPDAARRSSESLAELTSALASLGEAAPLVVKGLAFCTEVKSYGVFTALDAESFEPGQRVLVYAEVENLKSESTERGFHTAIQGSYQIIDSQGRRVVARDLALMEEHCANQRRDYFLSYTLDLPQPLYDGKYTLQLLIEDRVSQKLGQSSIDFTVRAPAS